MTATRPLESRIRRALAEVIRTKLPASVSLLDGQSGSAVRTGAWVMIGDMSGAIKPDAFRSGGYGPRWETTWTIGIMIGSGTLRASSAYADDAVFDAYHSVVSAVIANARLGLDPTEVEWARPTQAISQDSWRDKHETTMTVNIIVKTRPRR